MALWPVNGPAAGKKMPVTQEDLKKCRLEMVRRKVRWTEKLKTGRYEAGGSRKYAGHSQDIRFPGRGEGVRGQAPLI